jgi:hypothetical protein
LLPQIGDVALGLTHQQSKTKESSDITVSLSISFLTFEENLELNVGGICLYQVNHL